MITKPTLLLDRERCMLNIQRMVDKANNANVKLRPHFKTHQSLEVGNWMQSVGIQEATVSSLEMGKYFADGGWKDITVAFPVNVLEIDTINHIANQATLNLLFLDATTVTKLDSLLTSTVHAFIKLDTGYHRTGVAFDDFARLNQIIDAIEAAQHIKFKGFLHHAGHSYHARSNEEIAKVHDESLANMKTTFEKYKERFPNIEISVGDTPTCSVMSDFGCATEIRPGNFVFYDLMMVQITACHYDEIAVALACPVVAKHPERNVIIIHGGGVHFSKDAITENGEKYYGVVVENDGQLGWSKPIEGAILEKLSQEHGTIRASDDFIEQIQVGDIVRVLPVHSCMTANLLKKYLTTDGKWVDMMRVF